MIFIEKIVLFLLIITLIAAVFFSGVVKAENYTTDEETAIRMSQAALNQDNVEEAIQYLLPLAEKGNSKVQVALANIYILNNRPDYKYHDYRKSIYWLKRAAKNQYPPAWYMLGIQASVKTGRLREIYMYKYEMFKWMKLAADQGHAGAQMAMSDLYASGYVVEPDYIKAYMWELLARNRYSNEKSDPKKGLFVKQSDLFISERGGKANKLSARDKQKAESMAKDWENSHPDVNQTVPWGK